MEGIMRRIIEVEFPEELKDFWRISDGEREIYNKNFKGKLSQIYITTINKESQEVISREKLIKSK